MYLRELGLDPYSIDVPQMLGGRVKTLHPRVHAGILARRDLDEDVATLAEKGIEPFDLVVVNLYPFSSDPGVELIDVGGPAMLRGAAKNFAYVAPVCDPADYDDLLAELRERGEISAETRRRLAAKAFAHTSAYDASITRWLEGDELLPIDSPRRSSRSSSSLTAKTRTSVPPTTAAPRRRATSSPTSTSSMGATSRSSTCTTSRRLGRSLPSSGTSRRA